MFYTKSSIGVKLQGPHFTFTSHGAIKHRNQRTALWTAYSLSSSSHRPDPTPSNFHDNKGVNIGVTTALADHDTVLTRIRVLLRVALTPRRVDTLPRGTSGTRDGGEGHVQSSAAATDRPSGLSTTAEGRGGQVRGGGGGGASVKSGGSGGVRVSLGEYT